MKVLYIRTSTVEQNSDRQKQNNDKNCKIIEDKCSGAIPFFEREGGKKILKLTEKGIIDELIVHEIDRLGRNLIDILRTIAYFNSQKVNIEFKKQGLRTLNEDGTENDISKMVISILGVLIFVGLTAYDTQKIKNMYVASDSGELMGKKAVMGALTLYLDFINLFIMLLRLFGQRR